MTLQEIITEIPTLTIQERKQLLFAIFDSLTKDNNKERTLSILDFEGLGASLRDDTMDAQEYVNQLRSEWDHRP